MPTAKPKKKKTTTSRSKIPKHCHKKAQELAQKLARLRDCTDGYGYCISCGRLLPYEDLQGGHFIAKKNNQYLATDMDNIHAQCARCNMNMESEFHNYEVNLRKKIGDERVERLFDIQSASRGNEEAMERLSLEDQMMLREKRSNKWWHEECLMLGDLIKEYE